MPGTDAQDMDATVPLQANVTVPPAGPPGPPAAPPPAPTHGLHPIAIAAIVVGVVIVISGTFAGGIATGIALDGFGQRLELSHMTRPYDGRYLPRAPRHHGQQGKQGQRQLPPSPRPSQSP